MAKREAGNVSGGNEDILTGFAEDLGKLLGSVQNKAASWIDQRKAIAQQLSEIRDTATEYLHQLGAEGAHLAERFQKARRGRPAGSKNVKRGARRGAAGSPAPAFAVKATGKQKRTLSAAARKKISDAQKARWARQKKG